MTTTTLPATLAATRPGVLERMDAASAQAFAAPTFTARTAARLRLTALYPQALALAWTELGRQAPRAIIRAPRTRLGESAPAVTDLRRRA